MMSKLLALATLASVASSHMIMVSPVPYGKSSLTNGPLAADGSDFPCKQRSGVYDIQGASNIYKQGSTQQLSFEGSAVHAGGSCQVAVTSDLEPTKSSVWRVIKSIEGGCPAKNQQGNMGDNAAQTDPFKYDFDIPKELSTGNYTLAWVWFNKVGNREMYMNCAPMTVTGSGGSESYMSSLPNMFVANIGNGCGTQDSMDVLFPDPGKNVDKFNGATSAFGTPTGTGCAAGATGGSGGSSGGSGGTNSVAAPTSVAASQPPAITTAAPSQASLPGAVFVTAPDVKSTAPTSVAAPVAASSVAAAPVSAPTATTGSDSGSSPGSSSGGFAGGSACTTEGEWNCIGGTAFQRCASGTWTPSQPMAAGVDCTGGQSSDLQMASAQKRRVMRRAIRMA